MLRRGIQYWNPLYIGFRNDIWIFVLLHFHLLYTSLSIHSREISSAYCVAFACGDWESLWTARTTIQTRILFAFIVFSLCVFKNSLHFTVYSIPFSSSLFLARFGTIFVYLSWLNWIWLYSSIYMYACSAFRCHSIRTFQICMKTFNIWDCLNWDPWRLFPSDFVLCSTLYSSDCVYRLYIFEG